MELREIECKVCNVVYGIKGPRITFKDVEQQTDLHKEVLSRILRRLMIHGLIKDGDGCVAQLDGQ